MYLYSNVEEARDNLCCINCGATSSPFSLLSLTHNESVRDRLQELYNQRRTFSKLCVHFFIAIFKHNISCRQIFNGCLFLQSALGTSLLVITIKII